MFGLTNFISSILVSILGLLITGLFIFPNIFKLKKRLWISIKTIISLVLISFVILLSDASLDTYFFLGSFVGLGFLLKGILLQSRMSLILFLCSFLSFSLIFLSIGQTILFILFLFYAYILMIGFTLFLLFKNKIIENMDNISRKTQISSFIVLLAFPVLSMYILMFLSQNHLLLFEPISLYSLFSQNYEILALLIIFLIFSVILIFIFIVDFRTKHKQKGEETWFM